MKTIPFDFTTWTLRGQRAEDLIVECVNKSETAPNINGPVKKVRVSRSSEDKLFPIIVSVETDSARAATLLFHEDGTSFRARHKLHLIQETK